MGDVYRDVIPCAEAVRRLWEYLDGRMEPADHTGMEEHLSLCRRCCGELEFAKHLRARLASQSSVDLPREVVGRLERFIKEL